MGKVYASADWHGAGPAARKVFEFLQPDDTLIFLGDAIDRGSNGMELMETLLNDNRVIYLKGNHEDFFQYCMPIFIGNEPETFSSRYDPYIWTLGNGGNVTYNDAMAHYSNTEINDFITKLSQLPLQYRYYSPNGHTVILNHAGYTPLVCRREDLDLDEDALLWNDLDEDTLLWNRSHFYDNWSTDEQIKNTYMVHGHTPFWYLINEYNIEDKDLDNFSYKDEDEDEGKGKEACLPHIVNYCNGHKFDIDTGAAFTGVIALLDLDTFETTYITEKDLGKEYEKRGYNVYY